MYDIKYDVESILFSYYIKYDSMAKLNSHLNAPQGLKSVDIYIDLYDLLKRLYKQEYDTRKKFTVTASIINLAAHYRAYYRTRHRLWARIFLVYADESSNNHRMFIPTFGINHDDQMVSFDTTRAYIKSQLELVKILAAYIDDVYFIERTCDFAVFAYDNILKNPNELPIIITRSSYAYQIPALLQNAYIFRPKKTKDGDMSYCVKFNQALVEYYAKAKSETVLKRLVKINPQLLSILMDLNGCADKHVAGVTNITRATMLLEDAIDHNRIINGYNTDTAYLYNTLIGINTIIDPASFDYRFKALDIVYQDMIYNHSVESKDSTWVINLHDADTVKSINNQYFIDSPLDLNNL